jgi:hypothetical protein
MERRTESRHSLTCDVDAAPPSVRDQEIPNPHTVRGIAVNVSAGGACILGELSVERFSVLPCTFHFPEVPAPVPILMQVRWVEPVSSHDGVFRIGLSFLT